MSAPHITELRLGLADLHRLVCQIDECLDSLATELKYGPTCGGQEAADEARLDAQATALRLRDKAKALADLLAATPADRFQTAGVL